MDSAIINCGEPWDMDYVLHEAPHEFTRTHGRIDRCPACPATGRPPLSAERQRLAVVAELRTSLAMISTALSLSSKTLGSSSGGDRAMRDYFSIGPTPSAEDCAQVGQPDYRRKALAECQRFIELIRKTLGPEPEGAELAIKSFPHDFGTYYEVSSGLIQMMQWPSRMQCAARTTHREPGTEKRQP